MMLLEETAQQNAKQKKPTDAIITKTTNRWTYNKETNLYVSNAVDAKMHMQRPQNLHLN